jgi:hypothetical protein
LAPDHTPKSTIITNKYKSYEYFPEKSTVLSGRLSEGDADRLQSANALVPSAAKNRTEKTPTRNLQIFLSETNFHNPNYFDKFVFSATFLLLAQASAIP